MPSRWTIVGAMLGAILLAMVHRFWHRDFLKHLHLMGWAILLGLAYGWARTEIALSQQWTQIQSTTLHIVVRHLPEHHSDGRTRFIGTATTADGKQYRLLFQDYAARNWQVGEHWRVQARVRPAIATRNAVGFDREAWALANNIDGLASLGKERFRLPETSWRGFHGIRAQIVQSWQTATQNYPQGAALMKALAVGDHSALSSQAWAAFRPLGLNHLISISGLHITMIALLAMILTKNVMRFLPNMPQRPQKMVLIIGWLAAMIYTGLAGFQIPALRSLLMLSVVAWAWIWRKGQSSWQIWWIAMAAVLLYQPMAVLAVGFWLSFGLVGGLLWIFSFRLPENNLGHFWQYRYHIFKQAIIGQWAATLLGGIATIYLFGLLPIFSPFVNAVAIPVFSWILTPAALLASALPFDTPKQLAAWLGEHIMHILLFLGNRLPESTFAHAPLPLFAVAMCAVLLLLLPRGGGMKPLAMVILLAFLTYRPAVSGNLKATVYDVGQGLAVLIQTPTQNILFDTGTPAAEMALLPNLRAANVRHLDALILSHHDDDHDGAWIQLQQQLSIKTLWAGQPEFYPQAQYCAAGKHWQIDGVDFEFFTAAHQKTDNDKSCVLQVRYGDKALLLTGDISQNTENQLIAKYGKKLKSDILILAHHGSKSSSSATFLRTVEPKTAVASSGFANAYHHPHPDIQRRLAAQHIQLLRTDRQGGLLFDFTEKGIFYRLIASSHWWHRKPF